MTIKSRTNNVLYFIYNLLIAYQITKVQKIIFIIKMRLILIYYKYKLFYTVNKSYYNNIYTINKLYYSNMYINFFNNYYKS